MSRLVEEGLSSVHDKAMRLYSFFSLLLSLPTVSDAKLVKLLLKVMCPCKYSSFAGGMEISREISCDY